jgi:hypothetical protein
MKRYGKDFDLEVRASILPQKRYYHPKYLFWSDTPMSPDTEVRKVAISFVIQYSYPGAEWLGKRSIVVELPRKRKISTFRKNLPKWENEVSRELEFRGSSEFQIVQVNGFIALEE